MTTRPFRFRLAFVLGLTLPATALAQGGGNPPEPVKPSGPSAKKAADLIQKYAEQIETDVESNRQEIAKLRAELRELTELRYAMTDAIAELRGELAAIGIYSRAPGVPQSLSRPSDANLRPTPVQEAATPRRDFVYGLGSALPKEPTSVQRAQLQRLAPRADLKRMIEHLRKEVDENRADIDELAYELLELGKGLPVSPLNMGGGIRGLQSPWFGSMGQMSGMM